MGNVCDCSNINHVHQRVRRCLKPNHIDAGMPLHGLLDRIDISRVIVDNVNGHTLAVLACPGKHTPVHRLRQHDYSTRVERIKDRGYRCHAGGEQQAFVGIFQRRYCAFSGDKRWIVVTRINICRIDRLITIITCIGARSNYRRHDGPGIYVNKMISCCCDGAGMR